MTGRTSLDPRWRAVHDDGSPFPGSEHPSVYALRTRVPQIGVVMGVHKPDAHEVTWISINAVPLIHTGEELPYGVVCTFADITQSRNAEEALRKSESRLNEAQQVANIGSWEYDIAAGRMSWSDEIFRIFGLDSGGEPPPLPEMLEHCHPDDRDLQKGIGVKAARDGQPFAVDVRILKPNGEMRWVHVVGRSERDAEGNVIRCFGTIMDIHERRASEERFRVLFEQSSEAHLIFDENGVIDCNEATVKLLGAKDKSSLLGLHPAVLSPEYQPDGRRSDEKSLEMDRLARERGRYRFEWTHRKVDGTTFPVEVSLTLVTLLGKPVLLCVWHDLTERKLAEQRITDNNIILEVQKASLEEINAKLEALATTDGMTGLKNHRVFQDSLNEEIHRATRYDTPLSLVIMDVDHFKSYNDSFGHPAGDDVLRQVATILQNNARETDLAARYGGEEFVLILPHTDTEGALAIAERIRLTVESAEWPLRKVTISIGVSTLRDEAASPLALIAGADDALYQSKRAGRNRTTYHAQQPASI